MTTEEWNDIFPIINNEIIEDYCSDEVNRLLLKKRYRVNELKSFPTHSLSIKWIFVNFKISIATRVSTSGKGFYEIWQLKDPAERGWDRVKSEYGFDSPYEAAEEALLYTLTNLI